MSRISIVIPTLNRAEVLARTLDRLERQAAAPESFEVVVVSDPAEREPEALERALGGRPFELRHRVRHAPGVSAARNDGWRDARAPLVLFMGDDILASPGLVAEHLAWHERHPVRDVGVLGPVGWARELRVTPFMRWLEAGVQFDFLSIAGEEAGWGRFYTSNASVKHALLEQVGGFDEAFEFAYEDLDLAKRMADQGFRLLFARDAAAEHLHAPTVEEYRRRVAAIAVAESRFVSKHHDVEPYFKPLFGRAAGWPSSRGRWARLAGVVPRDLPWLGERVWTSADRHFTAELAPAFERAWDEAQSTSVR
ncbi:MAG: glycosyltransferase [Thermoleophilaceae bacterium]